MDVQNVVDRARSLSYVSSSQYADATAIDDFNIVYKELVSSVAQYVDEEFFYDILTATSVINQSEYTLDSQVNKVENVYIQYTNVTGDTFKKARSINKDDRKEAPAYYETNQSFDDPTYYISDNSLFIHPAPEVEVIP